jgi:biotin-[acetyl-CoA-carboxylase] ligase BirA-like protein
MISSFTRSSFFCTTSGLHRRLSRSTAASSCVRHIHNAKTNVMAAMSTSALGANDKVQLETLDGTQFFVWQEVDSTMDVARQVLRGNSGALAVDRGDVPLEDVFVVLAKRQVAGRGSRGRSWSGKEGNLFMTIVIKLGPLPIPLTLFPLRVGTLVIPHIRARMNGAGAAKAAFLKWPNDILIGSEKVCGTLVEIEDGRILIGVGCNVAWSPEVPSAGPDRGRKATHLAQHVGAERATHEDPCKSLASDIARGVRHWLEAAGSGPGSGSDSAAAVVQEFQLQMDLSATQRIRNGADADRDVLPLGVNADGSLLVRVLDTGEERSLVADYLY